MTTRRFVAVAAALVLVIALAVAGATAIAEDKRATAAGDGPALSAKRAGISPVPLANASGGGVKKKLRKLTRKYNKLARLVNAVVRDTTQCERVVNVTQYAGYDYNGVIAATTALDFTDAGDPADVRALVYIC